MFHIYTLKTIFHTSSFILLSITQLKSRQDVCVFLLSWICALAIFKNNRALQRTRYDDNLNINNRRSKIILIDKEYSEHPVIYKFCAMTNNV